MGWTKRQFVEQAFEEIGYAAYAFDLQPEQLQAALRRLEMMIATWNGKSVVLGYPLSSSSQSMNLDTETQVPDSAHEAIITNLALRIAPLVGKTVSTETKATARSSYMQLLSRFTKPNEQRFPNTLPAGAGNKPWRFDTPFLFQTEEPTQDGDGSTVDL